MKALVVDDERPAREELQWLLDQCDGVQVVAEADSADAVRDELQEIQALDVVFLDIDMPGLDGIQLADWLDERTDPSPAVVFVTAYEDYAVDAFELDAVDYLLKPVRLERLRETLERVDRQRPSADDDRGDHREDPLHRLSVEADDGLRVLPVEQVLMFEADDGGAVAVTSEGAYTTDFSLKALENLLPEEDFFRSHRSCIVRLDSVRRIVPTGSGTYRLHLAGDDAEETTAPLARSRADTLIGYMPSSRRVLDS